MTPKAPISPQALAAERKVRQELADALYDIRQRTYHLIDQSQGRFDYTSPHVRRVFNVLEGNTVMATDALAANARLDMAQDKREARHA